MNKALKITLGVVGAIILLIFVAILLIITFVDPNNYKPQISQLVEKYTGQRLVINGTLHWTLFPWLGIEVNDASLDNPTGFGPQPIAQVGEATVNVKLLSLLDGQVQLGDIKLNQVTLNLITNKTGQSNWQVLMDQASNHADKSQSTKKASPSMTFAISSLDIDNANVVYTNQQTQQKITISDLSFSGDNIQFGKKFDATLQFKLQQNQPYANLTCGIKGTFMIDLQNHSYIAKPLSINIKSFDPPVKGSSQQTYHVFSANLDFSATPKTLTVENLDAKLDKSSLTGNLVYNQNKNLNFKFDINQLNLNNLPHFPSISTTNANQKKAAVNSSSQQGTNTTPIKGNIKINQLIVGSTTINNFSAPVSGTLAVIKVSPITASIWGGAMNADMTIYNSTTPRYQLNAKFTNLELKNIKQNSPISGTANLTTNLTTSGSGQAALTRNLNGNLAFKVVNGYFGRININQILQNVSLFAKTGQKTSGRTQGGTPFSLFSATAVIRNGVVSTNDILVRSQNIKVTGGGTANLVTQRLNFNITILASGNVGITGDLPFIKILNLPIPVTITGTFGDPSVYPNFAAIGALLVKNTIQKGLNTGIEIGTKGGEAVGKTLQKGLESIFGN